MSQVSAPIQKGEPYPDALKKHIPAGLLGSFISANGSLALVPDADLRLGASWAVFAVLLIACPFWMLYYEKNKSAMQIVFACVSFVVLAFATGAPLSLTLTNPATVASLQVIFGVLAMILSVVAFPLISAAVGPAKS